MRGVNELHEWAITKNGGAHPLLKKPKQTRVREFKRDPHSGITEFKQIGSAETKTPASRRKAKKSKLKARHRVHLSKNLECGPGDLPCRAKKQAGKRAALQNPEKKRTTTTLDS